jgi:hypothetical protein
VTAFLAALRRLLPIWKALGRKQPSTPATPPSPAAIPTDERSFDPYSPIRLDRLVGHEQRADVGGLGDHQRRIGTPILNINQNRTTHLL